MENIDYQLKMSAYQHDIRQEYINYWMTSLNVIKNNHNREFIKQRFSPLWGQHARFTHNVRPLQYDMNMNTTNQYMATLRINTSKISCIYGMVYSDLTFTDEGPSFKHTHFCSGPTYNSQDGEYRGRIIIYEQLVELYKKYEEAFTIVQQILVDNLDFDVIDIVVFCPEYELPKSASQHKYGSKEERKRAMYNINQEVQDQIHREYINSIDRNRYTVKLLILSWLVDYYLLQRGMIENHVDIGYKQMIELVGDEVTFNKIISMMGEFNYCLMMKHITREYFDINVDPHEVIPPLYGQKIIPLSIADMLNIEDIYSTVWREYFITSHCSNLVLNIISPSFPFIGNWFLISDISQELFDNESMHNKFEESSIAVGINTFLKTANKKMYRSPTGKSMNGSIDDSTSDSDDDAVIKHNSKYDEGEYINKKFEKMSDYNLRTIMYAQKEIILTDFALNFIIENVGPTIKDSPRWMNDNYLIPGLQQLFEHEELFAKHMFEFIYAFYCMNTKLGIIHGDLHLNNVTIMPLLDMTAVPHVVFGRLKIGYAIADDIWMFTHTGFYSSLIDFSRAFIGDRTFLANSFGEHYADTYIANQHSQLVTKIEQHFPVFAEKRPGELAELAKKDFQLLFKIATIIDTQLLMFGIKTALQYDEGFTKAKVSTANIKLLDRILAESEGIILGTLGDACGGKILSIDDVEWSNLHVLQRVFNSYKLNSEMMTAIEQFESTLDTIKVFNGTEMIDWDKILLADVFVHDRDIVYDVRSTDNWGPVVSPEPMIRALKKQGLDEWGWISDWRKRVRLNEESSEYNPGQGYSTEVPHSFYDQWMHI